MAFAGALEDLAIPDVLQLLHVSRKSGTLRVRRPDGEQAVLHLLEGAIVGANHPSHDVNIGRVLLQLGAITQADLDEALRVQESAGKRERLIATLVELGRLDQKQGFRALERLIEETVVTVVGWETGSFEFDMSETAREDEFQHVPGTIDPAVSLDTQATLMDALRILDERNRAALAQIAALDGPPSAGPSLPPPNRRGDAAPGSSWAVPIAQDPVPGVALGGTAGSPKTPGPGSPAASLVPGAEESDVHARTAASSPPADDDLLLAALEGSTGRKRRHDRALVYCNDGLLKHSLRDFSYAAGIDAFVSEFVPDHLERLEYLANEGSPPVLVVDVVGAQHVSELAGGAARLVEQARARFPEVPLVVLTGADPVAQRHAFDLGASTVLVRPDESLGRGAYVAAMQELVTTLVACLQAWFVRHAALARRPLDCKRQVAVLRQRVHEIRYNRASSEVSLIVLRYVAEIFERCVIFLARRDDLLGLGAFGLDEAGETLSPAVVRLKIPLTEASILWEVVHAGRLFHGSGEDHALQTYLYAKIGAPKRPEVVLVPLRTEDKTAAVIYADFGGRQAAPVETDVLEILANQAGLALELALYRGRLGAR